MNRALDLGEVSLPAATKAIRAALDLHRPLGGWEGDPSQWECEVCADECGPKPWPCPTVAAVQGALTSHQHPTPLGSSGKCGHEARGITWAEQGTTAYACNTCEHEWTETN